MKSSTLKCWALCLIFYTISIVCYYFMMIIIVVVVCIFNQTGTSLILKTLWLYSCYFSIHSHCNTGSMEVAQREFGKSIIWEGNDSEFPKIWTIKLKHCISQQTKDIFLIWHYDIESIHLHFPLSRIFFRANLTSLFSRRL